MNTQIQELWKICVIKHTADPMNWQAVANEFATLIVKECLNECWYDATPKQISDNIKTKFGVE